MCCGVVCVPKFFSEFMEPTENVFNCFISLNWLNNVILLLCLLMFQFFVGTFTFGKYLPIVPPSALIFKETAKNSCQLMHLEFAQIDEFADESSVDIMGSVRMVPESLRS